MTISANFPNVQPSLLLDFANAKQLPPQVTFTRATSATYYDGSTTALAEQNLLLQSQDFSTTWARNASTVTTNSTAAPDGTTTADTVTTTSTDACLVYQAKPTSSAGTISCYIKKGTSDFAYMYVDNPSLSGNAAFFNINTGVVGSISGAFSSSSIVSVGSGWYRCIATFSGISGTNVGIGVSDSGTSTTVTNGRTIFIWGAQIENRSSATAYTATTTQPITNYVPVLLTAGGGQPRFDHNPTTSESLGLLIEEQRTNLIIYSADFNNAAWGKFQSSIDSNTIVAPDGTLTGDKLVEDTASSVGHFITQSVSLGGSVDSSSYVFIAYAKAGQRTRIRMFDNNQNTSGDTTFNLSTGTIVSGTGTITSVGNGWYRCAIFPLKNFSTTATPRIYLDDGTSSTYTGNGFSGVYIWGGQLEVASFATSYIPTTSAAATRAEDNAQLSGNNFTSWFNNDEGTIYTDTTIVGLQASAFPSIVALAGADPNVTNLGIGVGTAGGQYFSSGWLNGNIQYNINIGSGVVAGTSGRTITGYAANDFAASANAGTVGTASSGQVAPFTRFLIGGQATYQPKINAWYKKVSYYPQRVTNAQLQALTS